MTQRKQFGSVRNVEFGDGAGDAPGDGRSHLMKGAGYGGYFTNAPFNEDKDTVIRGFADRSKGHCCGEGDYGGACIVDGAYDELAGLCPALGDTMFWLCHSKVAKLTVKATIRRDSQWFTREEAEAALAIRLMSQ